MTSTLFFSCLFIFLLSGCSLGIENIQKGYALNSTEGVVVLSLTSSGECGWALFVDIQRTDKPNKHTINMQNTFEDRDWKRKSGECPSEKNDYSGTLAILALPPGKYEIFQITGLSNHHTFYSKNDFSVPFDVSENAVTYLGNAHFFIEQYTYILDIFDNQDRDLSLFKRQHPQIPVQFIIDILENATISDA